MFRRAIGAGALVALISIVGCAGSETVVDDDPSTTTTAAGGSGGQGGSGTGANASACGTDCSQIMAAQCQVGVCNPMTKQCEIQPDDVGVACDDGLFCTISDACDADGMCVGGLPNDCGLTPEECQDVTCDEMTQACSTLPKPDGGACGGTDLCIIGATCTNGLCLGGMQNECFFAPVPNDCHVAVCNPMTGMCDPQIGNEGGPCLDQNDLCTAGKTCDMGTCIGGMPKDCSSFSVGCFDGKCDTVNGNCYADPVLPGQPCTSGADACNTGTCDMNGMCLSTATNNGGMCTDGWVCTTGETCSNGICSGGTSTQTIYFMDDFSDNSAGWTLGTDWAIGATAESTGHNWGGPDPTMDRSPSFDNGVAGVVLGGNTPVVVHGYDWLESPVINTAGATTLLLEYYRWLNGGLPPLMNEQIQVYNGSTWVTIYDTSNLMNGVADTAWQHIVIDIATHANANMRIRFGYEDTIGFFAVGGWNVDDVLITSVQCN